MASRLPTIFLNIPETLGSHGVIGLFGKEVSHEMKQEHLTEALLHPIIIVLPRPISSASFLFIAKEIDIFISWAERLYRKPDVQIV